MTGGRKNGKYLQVPPSALRTSHLILRPSPVPVANGIVNKIFNLYKVTFLNSFFYIRTGNGMWKKNEDIVFILYKRTVGYIQK